MAWFGKGTKVFSMIAASAGAVKLIKSDESSRSAQLHNALASHATNFETKAKWDSNWDRRDPKFLVKPPKDLNEPNYQNQLNQVTPTASRNIILIRHGQYVQTEKEDENQNLTELGRRQAEITGQRLKDLNYSYNIMVHSTMARAKETADIIAQYLPKVDRKSCDLLREGAPFPPEPCIPTWQPEPHDFFQDGARIEAAFRKYFHRADVKQTENSYEIYVCHSNVIRYFICRALQLPPEAWSRLALHNASVTRVVIRPNGYVGLRYLGDHSHIPVDCLTYS